MSNGENIIKEMFKDNREVLQLDTEGHLYETIDGEIIYLDLLMSEFDTDKLADYVGECEELYEIHHHKKVNLYLICPSHIPVTVKEFEIKSTADFKIQVAVGEVDPCNIVLNVIKQKIVNNLTLDDEDIEALQLLPMMCEPSQQHEMRREVFKIMNEIT